MGKVIKLTNAKGKEVQFAVHHRSEYNGPIQKEPSEYGLYRIAGTDYYMSAPNMGTMWDLYLKTYDSAVPQDWFDNYLFRTGKAPRAVWCYDNNSIFGEPVFWADIEARFAEDVKKALVMQDA